jgi:hypothetical protein
VFRVLYLAQKYLIDDLIKSCASYIDELTPDATNTMRLFVEAQRCGDIPKKYVPLGTVSSCRNLTATFRLWIALEDFAASAIESSDFVLLDRTNLRELLRSDKVGANEVTVYVRLKAWAEHRLRQRYVVDHLTTSHH